MTEPSRRAFVGLVGGVVGAAALGGRQSLRAAPPAVEPDPCALPPAVRALASMTDGVMPISDPERLGRLEHARRLMADNRIGALLLEPGTSLSYFTGVGWGLSERPFLMLIPAHGEPVCVCPAFEEARVRERIRLPAEVRVWQEDESPY
ncbi:MAG: aminopeptidase P family N-terminal domain-containing protein, partial [Gemmatimonadales bacterium]